MLARKGEKALGGTFIVADRAVITLADFFLSLYSYSAGRSPLTVPGPVAKIMLALPGVNRLKSYFKDRTYDITRAEKALGYDPRISTSEGLENVIRAWPWGAELKPGKGE
jgi:nucleoside-diphosphate-sugar epimerase